MQYNGLQFKCREYVATALPVAVSMKVPYWQLEKDIHVDTYRDHMLDDLVIGLVAHVASMDGKTTTEHRTEMSDSERIQIPATWLDHVKRDLFPEWLKKRFPPKLETIVVTNIKHITQTTKTTHVCPHTSMNNQKHLRFLVHGNV